MREENYATHAVWSVVEELKKLLHGDLSPSDDGERYLIRRLHSAVGFVDGLRGADHVLVEQQPLDLLHTYLASAKQALTEYRVNPAAKQYLRAAEEQVPNIMATARNHFPWGAPNDAQRTEKAAATRYKNSLDQEASRLHAEVDTLREQLANTMQERNADLAKCKELLDALEEEIHTRWESLDKLQSNIQTLVTTTETQFAAELESRGKEFAREQELREDNFATAEHERADAAEKQLVALDKQAEDERAKYIFEAENNIASLQGYRNQAKALADETSRHAVAGEYGSWASHQARSAFLWTLTTVVVGLATAVGLIFALSSATRDSSQYIVYKLSISLLGLFVAAYTAHQATEHRREERTAKRLALDLAALQPFLEQINNEAELEKLRVAVANRVFVPGAEVPTSTESRVRLGRGNSISLTALVDLVRSLLSQGGTSR